LIDKGEHRWIHLQGKEGGRKMGEEGNIGRLFEKGAFLLQKKKGGTNGGRGTPLKRIGSGVKGEGVQIRGKKKKGDRKKNKRVVEKRREMNARRGGPPLTVKKEKQSSWEIGGLLRS